MIRFKIFDTETNREQAGEAEFAIVIADGRPVIVGAAPASKLIGALLGLAQAMVAETGPARIPVSARWQSVHAAIAAISASDTLRPVGARAPLTATTVMQLVQDRLGPAAFQDIREAVFEYIGGKPPVD